MNNRLSARIAKPRFAPALSTPNRVRAPASRSTTGYKPVPRKTPRLDPGISMGYTRIKLTERERMNRSHWLAVAMALLGLVLAPALLRAEDEKPIKALFV